MARSTKVAISLPGQMLKAIERERKVRGESRSEFFRRAAERLLKQEKEAKSVAEYVQCYVANPESPAEIEAADKAGASILAEEPWDETR